jgi:pteridine reductase
MEFEGKTALITGGAVRLGRSIARHLAGRGVNIVIHYRSSAGPAEALRDELRGLGVTSTLVKGDLVSEAACVEAIRDAYAGAGGLDILVNNAAVFHKDRLADVTEANVMSEFWPNLFAPLFLIRSFAARAESGRIVNMLDRRIVSDDVECVPYLLSKKGLYALTRLAALELAPRFTVNGVAPGVLLPPPGKDDAYMRQHGGVVPLNYQCTPEDIADAVVYLVESDAITGQVIYIDGGKHLLGTEHG